MILRIRNIIMGRMGSYALSKRMMKQIFEEIDIDGDGSLSVRELKTAMDRLKAI